MIVCICHRVSDRDIVQAARGGCESFEDLQDELRVATACGACKDCARTTFQALCPAGDARRLVPHGAMAAASVLQQAVPA